MAFHGVSHGGHDDGSHLLRRLSEVPVGVMSVARRGPVPPMPKQLAAPGACSRGYEGLAGDGMVVKVAHAQGVELCLRAGRAPAIAQRIVASSVRNWAASRLRSRPCAPSPAVSRGGNMPRT